MREKDCRNGDEYLVVNGWVESRDRDGFTVRDRNGYCYVDLTDLDDRDAPTPESVVSVEGRRTDAERSIPVVEPASIEVVNEATAELPLRPADRNEYDWRARLRNRHLDLRAPESHAVFSVRSAVVNSLRSTFESFDAVEVELPILVSTLTEAKNELFSVSYFDRDLYLLGPHSNPYKQLIAGSGFESFYAINKIFGYEGEAEIDPKCVTELTAVMFDQAFTDYHEFMNLVEELVVNVHEDVRSNCREELETLDVSLDVPGEMERLSYDRCLEIANESLPREHQLEWGDDLTDEAERVIGDHVGDYYFIVDWPASVRDFYVQPTEGDETVAKAFDLMHPKMELMSGSQREHRKERIVQRIQSEPKLDLETLDFYVDAFDHGIPPHSGGGMGLGRLLMALLDLDDVREAILFPRDREHVAP